MEKQKKKRSPADLLFLKGIFLDDNDEEQKVENVQFIENPMLLSGGLGPGEENIDKTMPIMRVK